VRKFEEYFEDEFTEVFGFKSDALATRQARYLAGFRSVDASGVPPVGRAFTVRRPSLREATFSMGGGAPKMSDLKAPTYEVRSPVGRAFI
jgi:hypothetical protein